MPQNKDSSSPEKITLLPSTITQVGLLSGLSKEEIKRLGAEFLLLSSQDLKLLFSSQDLKLLLSSQDLKQGAQKPKPNSPR